MAKAAEAHTFLNDWMQTLTERSRSLLSRVRGRADNTDLVELADMLLSRRGEASGVALAQTLLAGYDRASAEVRLQFLKELAAKFGPDQQRLAVAIQAYQASPEAATMSALHAASEPRRQELFRRLNLAPGGTFALVRMREDLVDHIKANPDLADVDADFGHLFTSWFNRGFLTLQPIRWSTPANILEKIIRYEAVHPISGWPDLKNRLEPPDRRCFAFFHPQLADEPLIFVEVALTTDIPGAVGPLLVHDRGPLDPTAATTAIFYSISNTQRGLAGVSFGHFLIKQVVEDLKRDLPGLKTFVTLSPVPGFAAWLRRERDNPDSRLLDAEKKEILALLDEPRWFDNAEHREALEQLLTPVAAHYFLSARTPAGRPVDPVARFHLGNGARLERLNFLGDPSDKGLRQAHGLMVNYLYDISAIERNHEAFAENGEVVASAAIRRAAKELTRREITVIP
ncbi:MAG: malonyl-CoA decarboxylase [Xanthobacteraceae bacterium]|nr:malonyl-CoA decarboxylase [Xanthobacteraceae bacterium]